MHTGTVTCLANIVTRPTSRYRLVRRVQQPIPESISAKLETKVFQDLLADTNRDKHRQVHLCLNRICGAGAWLFALLDSPDTVMAPSLFRTSLRRWLRQPLFHEVTACVLCGLTMDTKVVRLLAASSAEVRSPITLTVVLSGRETWPALPLPSTHSPPDLVDVLRPADLSFPRGPSGLPELTAALFSAPSFHPSSAFEAVEKRKCTFDDTRQGNGFARAGARSTPPQYGSFSSLKM